MAVVVELSIPKDGTGGSADLLLARLLRSVYQLIRKTAERLRLIVFPEATTYAASIDSASSVTTPLSLNALTASRVEIAASRIAFAASLTAFAVCSA
jgi:predicted amidohydrolase